MTTQSTARNRARIRNRTVRSLPALAGIGYTVAWVASLAVGAPNPSVAASGTQVMAAFTGHDWSAMAMFVLAEGIAAAALAIVVLVVARAARRQGTPRAGLAAASFGLAAAVVSWAELAMGAWPIYGVVPSGRTETAGTLYHALMRIDGAKMILLAAMAAALAVLSMTSAVLPRWLAPLGLLLAALLVASGLGYLLLAPGLAAVVYVAGTPLLVVVTATGVTMGISAQRGMI
jgi:hypothetical protein